MNQMLEAKTISYDLINSNVLFQPKWQKVTYMVNIHSRIMEVIYDIYFQMNLSHAPKLVNLNLY